MRARQGKLKAIKIGKKWVTKKEWLEDYVFEVEEYKSSIYQERTEEIKEEIKEEVKEEIKEEVKEKKDKEILEKVAETFAPRNLPVGEFEFILPSRFVKKPTFQFGLVFVLLLFLLIAGGTFGKVALKNALNNISQTAYSIGETRHHKVVKPVSQNLARVFQGVKKGVSKITDKIIEDEINVAAIENTITVFEEYTIWLGTNINEAASKIQNLPPVLAIKKTSKFVWQNVGSEYVIAQDFFKKEFSFLTKTASQLAKNFVKGLKLAHLRISNSIQKEFKFATDFFDETAEFVSRPFKFVYQFAQKFYQISLSLFEESKKKEGMVVIPSTEEDEAVKEKIKESFSDEVKVELTDKSSGIITPIFRDGEGDNYMYVLVPINK